MKIERLDVKDGQFGPYTVFSAGGDSYSAFGRHHTTLSRFKVGDDIDFQWELKGNYKRVTNVNGPGVSTSPSTPPNTPVRPAGTPSGSGGYTKRDPAEFNLMMATRYALDAIMGNAAATPKDAVSLIKELYNGFIDKVEPPKPDMEAL